MTSKITKSWERTRTDVHSPLGVAELRKEIKYGLMKKYIGIAESMFRYDGFDSPEFEDMQVMCQDTLPEMLLMKNGMVVWFKIPGTDQIHCLPVTYKGGVNIYGKMTSWSPVPVGYSIDRAGTYSEEVERIRDMTLTYDDSVIMRNDLFGGNDEAFILKMIDELVDNMLTMNQLQLIAKCPFVFNVTEDNLLSAKNFFLAMCEDRPAIFTNALGESPNAVTESTQSPIDPALFDLFDRWECQILEYIGFPCNAMSKRAQMSVSEVSTNKDKIYMRRQEKLNQRKKACDRINALFGTNLSVASILDEMDETFTDAYGDKLTEDEVMQ